VAKKVETVLLDDLDGSKADTTIRFDLDGVEYEIDLSATHADDLRKVAEPYVEAGRKISASSRRSTRSNTRRASASGGPTSSEVRNWAKGQGFEVKERGRMPAELVIKFQAATEI